MVRWPIVVHQWVSFLAEIFSERDITIVAYNQKFTVNKETLYMTMLYCFILFSFLSFDLPNSPSIFCSVRKYI